MRVLIEHSWHRTERLTGGQAPIVAGFIAAGIIMWLCYLGATISFVIELIVWIRHGGGWPFFLHLAYPLSATLIAWAAMSMLAIVALALWTCRDR